MCLFYHVELNNDMQISDTYMAIMSRAGVKPIAWEAILAPEPPSCECRIYLFETYAGWVPSSSHMLRMRLLISV